MKPTLVILESPFKGKDWQEEDAHREYARSAMRDSLLRGEAPMVSHLLYTQALDDSVSNERRIGIAAGLAWGKHATKTVVYCDHGLSDGMLLGIAKATAEGRLIEYRYLYNQTTKTK